MIANCTNKENISNEENNALFNLRGYHSDEDGMPTGQPKVNLQLFCNTFLLLVLIHPICIQYKVQKYSELEESMKAGQTHAPFVQLSLTPRARNTSVPYIVYR